MTSYPLSDVIDAPLVLSESAIDQLRLVPQVHQFDDLPGEGRSGAKSRLEGLSRELVDTLIQQIAKESKVLKAEKGALPPPPPLHPKVNAS